MATSGCYTALSSFLFILLHVRHFSDFTHHYVLQKYYHPKMYFHHECDADTDVQRIPVFPEVQSIFRLSYPPV